MLPCTRVRRTPKIAIIMGEQQMVGVECQCGGVEFILHTGTPRSSVTFNARVPAGGRSQSNPDKWRVHGADVIASATAMLDMRFERASNRGKCACPLSIAKERFLFGMREFIRHTSIHVARGGSMPPLIPPDTPCFPPAGVIFCPLGGGLFLEEPRRHADRFAGLNRDR